MRGENQGFAAILRGEAGGRRHQLVELLGAQLELLGEQLELLGEQLFG